jgi:ketosteroid isomerase-like protein
MQAQRFAEILEADDRRYAAMRAGDTAALGELLHDSLIYTHSSGTVHDKAGFIDSMKQRSVTYLSTDRREVEVRWHDEVAVLHGHSVIEVDVRGSRRTLDLLFQSVWVQQSGRWQMAAWASTPLPAKT